MEATHILSKLNDKQREAVSAPLSNLLVLAGAGSGKTSVLVSRIAWLIEESKLSPANILAVTFTNKAAAEMRQRLNALLQRPLGAMWVGTFHSLTHRMLRAHWQDAKLNEHFQIMDSEDQLRLIKRLMKSMNIDDERWQPRDVQSYINRHKDEGSRPGHIEAFGQYEKKMLELYEAYEQACQRAGVIDFAELLLRSLELLRHTPALREHYQQRFQAILVDEFQDTNAIQYAWLQMLKGQQNFIMAVGDDDQSIYGWRGARIENIHQMAKDFAHTKTIRLEQNYRSTQTILSAANHLISHNRDRLGKELWTEGQTGEAIALYEAFNEVDEARYIVGQIQLWVERGGARQETAILYRSNAQSRVLEEALIQAGLPYRVYGGLRFFDRAEIKDALAYLRLATNRNDDPALERIINNPPRGIGERTITNLREVARSQQISLWQAASSLIQSGELTARAQSALTQFMQLIDSIDAATRELTLAEQVEHVIIHSGLLAHHQQSKLEKAQARVENLQELMVAAKQFTPDENQHDLPLLAAFLSHAALEAGEAQADEAQDSVQLMTLHSAKGLEFPLVFLAGMEDGLFPHQLSLEEPGRLEEERRLCYVGMTRAMQQLHLSYAQTRRQYGRQTYHRPSRFLQEIPAQYLAEVRTRGSAPSYAGYPKDNARKRESASLRTSSQKNNMASASGIAAGTSISDTGLQLGQTVYHGKFGDGVITNFEGSGAHARIQVNFKRVGKKWLVLAYANLQV
jgi:ATP-dependent DNA helicase UvrD/PcrA